MKNVKAEVAKARGSLIVASDIFHCNYFNRYLFSLVHASCTAVAPQNC